MRIAVVPSKQKADAQIKRLTAEYLASGGVITYLAPGLYTPAALSIYNPNVDHAAQEKRPAKYFDDPA